MNRSLETLFVEYIRFCTHTKALRPATISSYKDAFRLFIRLMPEIQTTGDLSPQAIDEFFARLRLRRRVVGRDKTRVGVKASTIRTYGSKLHSFFDWLCVRDLLAVNPVDRNSLAMPDYSDKRALERSEVERVIAAIAQHSSNRFLLKRNMAMVHVLLFAGLRKTELLSLKVRDLDLQKRTLFVRGTTSKSKVSRGIPLTWETITAVEDYIVERRMNRRTSEYLWTSVSADKPLTAHSMKHWVETLRQHSGVNFHLHRFRHTYACMLGRNNVSAVKIQKLLGHCDLRMTQTYLRSLGVEDLRDSVQFLSLDNLPGV